MSAPPKEHILHKPGDLSASRPPCAPGVEAEDGQHCIPSELLRRIAEDVGVPEAAETEGSSEVRRKALETTRCTTERCLASKVTDGRLRRSAVQCLRPSMPEHWKTNPEAWLSNQDIDRVMRQYAESVPDFTYLGALPLNFDAKGGVFGGCLVNSACSLTLEDLARRRQRYVGVIVNTDPQGMPGRHWMACFLDVGRGLFTFFDSVGKPPRPEVRGFCERMAAQYRGTDRYPPTLRWSTRRFQQWHAECGVYAMLFVAHMANGGSFRKFLTNELTDENVNQLRARFFDGSLEG